jgi:hypothetical protein
MYRSDELDSLRARLAPELLAIDGVAAVGSSTEALNVYLSAESDAVRGRVEEAVRRYGDEIPINFVVSGHFNLL